MMPSFQVSLSVTEGGRNAPQYTLETDLNGEVTLKSLLEWTKSALIITADEVLKEEQARGFDKQPILAVDGRVGKPIQNVNPLGQIEFTARQNIKDVLFETYEALLYRSKVLTGQYKTSHFVFLNGTQIASSLKELESWYAFSATKIKENDLIRFVNIQPYARKLERYGVTAQRSSTKYSDGGKRRGQLRNRLVLTPNGTYYLTARAIRAKYKRNSIIRFSFIPGSSLGIAGSFKGGRKGRNSSGRPYLYPSITISVQERGTL